VRAEGEPILKVRHRLRGIAYAEESAEVLANVAREDWPPRRVGSVACTLASPVGCDGHIVGTTAHELALTADDSTALNQHD
jgi:hypothetical protein